ncbi:MAG: ABC transporter ATP-binding protein [Candidatus Omnitrophica bacterium]|nr:ABC transporter ATP-binding protein [Candidatus Omnitrophota bacterium]
MKIIMAAFRYLKRYPAMTCMAFFSMLGTALFEGISFGMLVPLIQSMINSAESSRILVLMQKFLPVGSILSQEKAISIMFVVIFLALCLKNVFLYFSTTLIMRLRLTVTRDLSASLVDRLIGYDMAYFDRAKTGYLTAHIDAETIRIGSFIMSVLSLGFLITRVATFVVVLFLISWKASVFLSIMIAVVLLPLEILMKRLARVGERRSSVIRDFSFKMLEILNGIRLIKERGTEEEERRNFRAVANDMYRCQCDLSHEINMLVPLSETVIFGLITISFLVLLNVIRIDMAASLPSVAAYMLILVKMLAQLNQLNAMRSTALSDVAALNNYENMSDTRGKMTVISGARDFRKLSGEINFENVEFAYEPHKPVFRSLSLAIPQGKMTAVVGSSGAGKTTLVNLIMRFYDPVRGRVTVDGIDLRQFDLRSWRRKIGFVSQNLFLFNKSVRDNITYGVAGVTDEQVLRAAKIAHADEFIQGLPQKYDTIVGERGVQLSGGQRQRLSIARAIIENPEILILDEATSSLDSETETLISDAIEAVMARRTVVAIAHRLATVVRADAIIVLDNGAAAARGTHDELIGKSGIYRKLYEKQFSV